MDRIFYSADIWEGVDTAFRHIKLVHISNMHCESDIQVYINGVLLHPVVDADEINRALDYSCKTFTMPQLTLEGLSGNKLARYLLRRKLDG